MRLVHEVHGDPSGVPLLLVAGLGLDLTSWPTGMVDGLVAAGFRVITFDNRDAGASPRPATPPPSRLRQLLARPRPDAYDLGDMATDTVGLLDELGIDSAHVVGMSMGGMIAQTVAARHPERVRTLTSIFSTTGDRSVGQPARSTLLLLVTGRPARTEEEYVAGHLRMLGHIASTVHLPDEARERAWAAGAWRRGPGAGAHAGTARQISAIQKSGDRTTELRRITAPTLVVHGDTDLMVAPTGGRATAAAIPGARHVVVHGMAHHFPPSLDDYLVDLVVEHATSRQTASNDASDSAANSATHGTAT